MQLAGYFEGSPLMWMMLLHVNLNADDDYDDDIDGSCKLLTFDRLAWK